MKKLLAVIGLSFALVATAAAQNHQRQSFLAVNSVVATNLVNPTNFGFATSWRTNVLGLTWTNGTTRYVAGNGDTTRILQDVSLWSDSHGRPFSQLSTNVTVPTAINTPATIVVKTIAGAVADSAVTFHMAPVYNDNVGESTAERWVFSFTPTVSTTQVWSTNAPLYLWPGAKKLRCLAIVNADTTTGDGSVKITEFSLNGFVP